MTIDEVIKLHEYIKEIELDDALEYQRELELIINRLDDIEYKLGILIEHFELEEEIKLF